MEAADTAEAGLSAAAGAVLAEVTEAAVLADRDSEVRDLAGHRREDRLDGASDSALSFRDPDDTGEDLRAEAAAPAFSLRLS